MPKQYELLVFDWDGTLMDSAATISSSIQMACRDLDLKIPSDEQARHIIGLGLNEAIAHLLPELPKSEYENLVDRYRHHFLSRDEEIPLFEGALETVRNLHAQGFLLAVATGKSRRGLDRAMQHTGLVDYFHSTRCADECFSKPHPAMLEEIMDELGASRDQTLMIGDTSHDLQMASNAGVKSLAVAYGAHPKAGLLEHHPLQCFDQFSELSEWLTNYA